MYVRRNTEARSCNHWYSGLVFRTWVCVALGIQHATHMRLVVVCGLSGSTVFFHITHGTIFERMRERERGGGEKLQNACVLMFSVTFVWNISHSKKKWARYDKKMYIGLRVKCPLFLSDFKETWIFFDRFSNNPPISSSIKIRSVGTELFHADGRTDIHDEANSRYSQFCERA